MGCGNSTSVQTFNDPEATNYNRNQGVKSAAKAPSRQSSAPKDRQTNDSSSPTNVAARPPSSTSSKKIKSRGSSARSVNSRRSNRSDSASTKKTYLIQRNNSDIVINDTNGTKSQHENENVVTDYFEEEQDAIDEKQKRQSEEENKQYEEIQKQTFLTGNPKDEKNNNFVFEDTKPVDKDKQHEVKACLIEERRSSYNPDAVDNEAVDRLDLKPMEIPEMDPEQTIGEYTIDDIVEHNNEVASNDWFKYGRNVYSYEKMRPIIQARVNEIKERDIYLNHDEYPIHYARKLMITRQELPKILEVCHVGNWSEIPREEYMARMKQCVEHVLEELNESEYVKDYKSQLSRWLCDYPYSKVDNDKMDANIDANKQVFPLPKDILVDPSVLRKWIETWEAFDLEIPEGGCWQYQGTLGEDWGDAHEIFAELVQTHDDKTLDPLDMNVDGDVAWVEIELDILKNDVTTPDQEAVWKTRATRKNLNDPVWQADRRKKLGEALKARYENTNIDYPLEDHARFAELLEDHWKEFQILCEKEFSPPPQNVRITKSRGVSKTASEDDHYPVERRYSADKALGPETETRVVSKAESNDDQYPAERRYSTDKALGPETDSIRSNSRPGSKASVSSRGKNSTSSSHSDDRNVAPQRTDSKMSNRSGSASQRPDSKMSNKSDSSSQRPDSKMSNRSDSASQRPGSKMSKRSDSSSQRPDSKMSNRSDSASQRPDSKMSKRSDSASQRPDSKMSDGRNSASQRPVSTNSQFSEAVRNGPVTEMSKNVDVDANGTQRRGSDTNSLGNGSVEGKPVTNADNKESSENESGRKSSDVLAIDGEVNNANVGVQERVSTTETMDSGLELDNFENFSKS